MPYPIDKKLVIAVASSALFDLTESHQIYKEQGVNLNNSVLFFKIMDFHNELTNNEVFTTAIPNFRQQYTNNNKRSFYISKTTIPESLAIHVDNEIM